MTTPLKLDEVLDRLMIASETLSPLLANTTAMDSVGRSLRLIDLLISQAVRTIRQGRRFGQSAAEIFDGAGKLIEEARQKAVSEENWLRANTHYISRTSDSRSRCGRPVPGAEIADGAKALQAVLTIGGGVTA